MTSAPGTSANAVREDNERNHQENSQLPSCPICNKPPELLQPMIGCAVCKILVHQSCAEQFDDHIEAGGLDMESYVCATCFGREDISDQTKDRNAFKIRYLLREPRARDEAL
jgi:hypothetical protein